MTQTYEYRLPGRRPIMWLALIVAAFLLGVAALNAAPWFIWLIWGVSSVMVLYLLVVNPVSGIRITPEILTVAAWRDPKSIALCNIEKVEIIDWSDSTSVVIHLKSGERLPTFSGDMPPADCLIAELTARDVTVIRL